MQDERTKLILEMGGDAAVKAMTAEVQGLESQIKSMITAWQNGSLATGDFIKQSGTLQGQIDNTKGTLDQLKGVSDRSGQGVLGASYAVQDFVSVLNNGGPGSLGRALGSVTNNVGPVLAALGMSGGMAAAFSLLGVGIAALEPVVEHFFRSFSGEAADKAKEVLTDLQKKVKETQTELEKIVGSKSSKERETQAGFEEFFAEEGGKKIHGAIAKAIGASGRGEQMTEEERRSTDDDAFEKSLILSAMTASRAGQPWGPKEEQEARIRHQGVKDAVQKRINEANVEAAGNLLGKAPTDKGARQSIAALARAYPGAFPKGFESGMASMEPEAMEAFDAETEAFDSGNREWARTKDAHREKVKKRKKIEELNQQGQDNQRQAEKDLSEGMRKDDKANIASADHRQKDAQRKHAAAMKEMRPLDKHETAAADQAMRQRYYAEVALREAAGGLGLRPPAIMPGSKGVNAPRPRRPIRKLRGDNKGFGDGVNAPPRRDISAAVSAQDRATNQRRDAALAMIAQNEIAAAKNDAVRVAKIQQMLREADQHIAKNRSGASNGTF